MHTQNPGAPFAPISRDEAPFAHLPQNGDAMRPMTENKTSGLPGLSGGPSIDARSNGADEDIAKQLRLSRPAVLSNGQTVEVIRFREPTFRDALDCGEIIKRTGCGVTTGGAPRDVSVLIERDAVAIERWFCRLTKLPSSLFTKISARDGNKIIVALIELTEDIDRGNSEASLPTFGSVAG